MKGIAITLATREDSEAIARIEKLIGYKIPRVGGKAVGASAPVEKAPKAASKPAPKAERKKEEPRPQPKRDEPADRSPVVEDISNDWNGPLPSFLSKSAG
jgi:superfamily II DNA/RNA helicase